MNKENREHVATLIDKLHKSIEGFDKALLEWWRKEHAEEFIVDSDKLSPQQEKTLNFQIQQLVSRLNSIARTSRYLSALFFEYAPLGGFKKLERLKKEDTYDLMPVREFIHAVEAGSFLPSDGSIADVVADGFVTNIHVEWWGGSTESYPREMNLYDLLKLKGDIQINWANK